MFVYLHAPDHDDTDAYCRQVICSESLISLLKEKNFVVWAGNIQYSEAYQVSNVLAASSFPFCALITLQGSRMTIIDRFEGILTSDELLIKLQAHTSRLDGQLASIRRDRAEREQARLIREQQDRAYLASLKADEEKFKRQKEEEERRQKEQEDRIKESEMKASRAQSKKERIEKLKANFPPEVTSSDKPLTRISIRLPNGNRLIRQFEVTAKVQDLMDFIEIQDLSPIPFESDADIVNTYPRKVIDDMNLTLEAAGLAPNASLFVEERIE